MTTRTFSDAERTQIKQLITEGINVTGEIEALRGGLNDTVKAIADTLDLKPALLKKAIKVAAKASREKQREEFDDLEYILDAVSLG